MCVCDETEAKSLLDDEIFVATGRMPLSAKAFGDVGGRLQARSAFQRAFVSVCLRDGSAYAGRRGMGKSLEVSKAGRLCVRGAPTAWRDPKDGYDGRRGANTQHDGLARASVARTRALVPQSTCNPAMCPGLQVAEWRCAGLCRYDSRR